MMYEVFVFHGSIEGKRQRSGVQASFFCWIKKVIQYIIGDFIFTLADMKKKDNELLVIDIIWISVLLLIIIFIVWSFIYYQKTWEYLWNYFDK